MSLMAVWLCDLQFHLSFFFIKRRPHYCISADAVCVCVAHWRLCLCSLRSNLKGLYRGDVFNVYNCHRSIRPSRPALVCWMGFTSYQAAFICLGKSTLLLFCSRSSSFSRQNSLHCSVKVWERQTETF